MGDIQKAVTLTIEAGEWSEDAGVMLAPAFVVPGALDDCAGQVRAGEASLFRIFRAGELVAAYVLRVDRCSYGDEGVIVAAAGILPGGSLLASVLPHIETQFSNVERIRLHTARPGMAAVIGAFGYAPQEIVFSKRAEHGRRVE